ncbi:MAG: hypothetical protein GY768_26165 [Planctomycetaceae bacterium]|nr:hypothetical protein [Planctomycetaceae bacterium]
MPRESHTPSRKDDVVGGSGGDDEPSNGAESAEYDGGRKRDRESQAEPSMEIESTFESSGWSRDGGGALQSERDVGDDLPSASPPKKAPLALRRLERYNSPGLKESVDPVMTRLRPRP